jgi:hypothetical protein
MDLKKVAVLVCVLLTGAGAFAFSFIGPPTAELEKTTTKRDEGKTKITSKHFETNWGYIFSFSEQDIGVGGESIEDFQMTRHYFTWGIAIDENFNFNVLLGGVSGEADKKDINDALGVDGATSDFDGDWGFSPGFNLKCTFIHGETVDWGATYQMTWFSTEDTVDTVLGPVKAEFDNAYDIQVAVGPTVDMGCWDLYGGAFYYMLDGDVDFEYYGFDIGSLDIEEDDNFGGFIGAKFELMKNTDFVVEYALGNDSQALSGSLGWRF